jgi:hypothetical protein
VERRAYGNKRKDLEFSEEPERRAYSGKRKDKEPKRRAYSSRKDEFSEEPERRTYSSRKDEFSEEPERRTYGSDFYPEDLDTEKTEKRVKTNDSKSIEGKLFFIKNKIKTK